MNIKKGFVYDTRTTKDRRLNARRNADKWTNTKEWAFSALAVAGLLGIVYATYRIILEIK